MLPYKVFTVFFAVSVRMAKKPAWGSPGKRNDGKLAAASAAAGGSYLRAAKARSAASRVSFSSVSPWAMEVKPAS